MKIAFRCFVPGDRLPSSYKILEHYRRTIKVDFLFKAHPDPHFENRLPIVVPAEEIVAFLRDALSCANDKLFDHRIGHQYAFAVGDIFSVMPAPGKRAVIQALSDNKDPNKALAVKIKAMRHYIKKNGMRLSLGPQGRLGLCQWYGAYRPLDSVDDAQNEDKEQLPPNVNEARYIRPSL